MSILKRIYGEKKAIALHHPSYLSSQLHSTRMVLSIRLDGQVHCSRQGIMLPFQADDQSVGIAPFARSAAPHPLKTMAIAPFHAGGGVGAARDRAK